jgi:hypothetical protein
MYDTVRTDKDTNVGQRLHTWHENGALSQCKIRFSEHPGSESAAQMLHSEKSTGNHL